jgi:hypothetical protein
MKKQTEEIPYPELARELETLPGDESVRHCVWLCRSVARDLPGKMVMAGIRGGREFHALATTARNLKAKFVAYDPFNEESFTEGQLRNYQKFIDYEQMFRTVELSTYKFGTYFNTRISRVSAEKNSELYEPWELDFLYLSGCGTHEKCLAQAEIMCTWVKGGGRIYVARSSEKQQKGAAYFLKKTCCKVIAKDDDCLVMEKLYIVSKDRPSEPIW